MILSISQYTRHNTAGAEKAHKRDLNHQYYRTSERSDFRAVASSNLPTRGDIPITHGDCDGEFQCQIMSTPLNRLISLSLTHFQIENLLRGINDLIALVKKLREDVAAQNADIKRLQSLIENCAGCQEPQPLRMDTCQYANPCFPGENRLFLDCVFSRNVNQNSSLCFLQA